MKLLLLLEIFLLASCPFGAHGRVVVKPEDGALDPLAVCENSDELAVLLADHDAEIHTSEQQTERRLSWCGWCDDGIDYFCLITAYCNPYTGSGGYRHTRSLRAKSNGLSCSGSISEIEDILTAFSSAAPKGLCKDSLASKMLFECI